MSGANEELVELGDLDELVRHTDRLATAGAWGDLADLRERCQLAAQRGRQLWPVASRCEYRLALDAPGEWAASVLVPGTGRFALGPLTEVAASTHAWEDLAPHVVQGAPEAAIAAHERVVRGEDLHGDRRLDPFVLEVPLQLASWEPRYPVAEYLADEARFPADAVEPSTAVDAVPGPRAEDRETVRALVELASGWSVGSNGEALAVAVRGDAASAIGTLGHPTVRVAALTPAQAMSLMAWTAASGGAHGRRRGMAPGRFAAWWAGAALTGLLEDFPPDPNELGDALGELRWWSWDDGSASQGWSCRLAVEDPADGLAWALDATDSTATSSV